MSGSPPPSRAHRRQSTLGRWKDEVAFRLRPPQWDDVVTEDLTFGSEATARFSEAVGAARSYLEFGAGASTLCAASHGCCFVTVESDPSFLTTLQRKCGDARGTFIHADIGATGPWGVPRKRRVTQARVAQWERYPTAPWRSFGEGYRADLILVDGRFRGACLLATVIHQQDTDWTLLFDDYVHRPEYEEVEEFARLVGRHGRMAEFTRMEKVNLAGANAAFQRMCADWR